MGENSAIEWCTHTFNPWFGCTNVGPACDHCYAEAMMANRLGKVEWGAGNDRVRTSLANWNQPLKWNSAAKAAGRRDTVFCLSLGDIWDNEVDPFWRWQLFDLIRETSSLTWLLLSKRIGNAVKMCDPSNGNRTLPRNCALGATMVTQEEWDRDMPKLTETARILEPLFTFASVEPMLGPINARGVLPNWVITGGESGPGARPAHPDWFRSLRDQCVGAGTAYFHKQNGNWAYLYDRDKDDPDWRKPPTSTGHHERYVNLAGGTGFHGERVLFMRNVGKKAAGRLLDGVEHNAMPVTP